MEEESAGRVFRSSLSPICVSVAPRRLDFSEHDMSPPLSPPYRRVQELRLLDSPGSSWVDDSALGSLPDDAPLNPFTPEGQLQRTKRHLPASTPHNTPLRCRRLLDHARRYSSEFVELEVLGAGHFGRVTRCLHRLDGCCYAVKRSFTPHSGQLLREVYAHAALPAHPNVVRYFSSWVEGGLVHIQSEYCGGGSLATKIDSAPLADGEVRVLLRHAAAGLAHIHAARLVHMDLKPANVLLQPAGAAGETLYKLADLGHATLLRAPDSPLVVEEGDCRYLPREVLQEDFSQLSKADIFALGLTVFEAGGGGPLPKNGPLWHQYRDGALPDLAALSPELNKLIKRMVHPEATSRPSAGGLQRHPLVRARTYKTRAQLRREAARATERAELLQRRLHDLMRFVNSLPPSVTSSSTPADKRAPTPHRRRSARKRH